MRGQIRGGTHPGGVCPQSANVIELAEMPKPKRDPKREKRITMEIVVDAYSPEEQAMGWYYYLEEKLRFPFRAKCIAQRAISPLLTGSDIEVVGMASEDECHNEMFVTIKWDRGTLAVPLSQIRPTAGTDAGTKEGIADWHYWVSQGYEL